MYVFFNPNPCRRSVGDCSVRAIAKALDLSWDEAFQTITERAFELCDMPSSDAVWGSVLKEHGFHRQGLPSTCPDCYTAEKFCEDNPHGVYVLGFGDNTGNCTQIIQGNY